jgi:SAM-dependent methyltransferase
MGAIMASTSEQHWDPQRYEQRARFVREGGIPLQTLLAPQAGERILDLGCGPGTLTASLAETGAEVVGLDSSPQMIAEARRAYPGLDFVVGHAETLAYDREFDALFSNAALHWMTRPREVASNMLRALKPNGRLVAEFGGDRNVAGVRRAVDLALAELGIAEVSRPWCPWYFPRLGEYASLLEDAGFVVRAGSWFPRPSAMPDSEARTGLAEWLELFAGSLLETVPEPERATLIAAVERAARPELFRDGVWWIDYARLRVEATRPG